MANKQRVAITGLGYAVGSKIRSNDWEGFDWIKSHAPPNEDLFKGYKNRAVLAGDQSLTSIMTDAAAQALDQATLAPTDVDVLTGYGSVPEYVTPNTLAEVHQKLNMGDGCWLMPVQSEYTNYLLGLRIADGMIKAGQAEHVLVVCGCNWTRYVDYHEAPALSVGDGACAAVVARTSDASRFSLMDSLTHCDTSWYGVMTMNPRPINLDTRLGEFTKPVFNLNAGGREAFQEFGAKAPPKVAREILQRNDIPIAEATFITHQASTVLLDLWRKALGAREDRFLNTMEKWGNMTLASIGVTLAHCYERVETKYLVLLGIGTQQETSALLLSRR